MAVTSKDIAEACGVSQGTVDRAFHNRSGISVKTKNKILETSERMGYRPHLLARSLVKGKTMTIGLVVFDLYNSFFAQLINAIEQSAREQGYFVYLTLTEKNKEVEKLCVEHLVSRKVDGLFICSVHKGEEYEKYLKGLNIPILSIGNKISDAIPFVGIDDYSAMKDAALHVFNKGYNEIIYVSPPLAYKKDNINIYAQEQRLQGFYAAVKEVSDKQMFCKNEAWNNWDNCIILDNKDYINSLIKLNIKSRKQRAAILCSNDIYALEVFNSFCYQYKSDSIVIPSDFGLMGFDNIDVLKYIHPTPATVSYPIQELGSKAVELLLEGIQGKVIEKETILKHTIIEGETL